MIKTRHQNSTTANASELLNRSFSNGGNLLLHEHDLGDDFFNLRTGIAGEIMQKFVNYQQKLVIVVANPQAYGERFEELYREHQSHPFIRFLHSEEEARKWLSDAMHNA